MLGKPAAQITTIPSSGNTSFDAGKAVDGIYQTEHAQLSAAVSTHVDNPWWRVDLGEEHCVWAVNIVNIGCKMHILQIVFNILYMYLKIVRN